MVILSLLLYVSPISLRSYVSGVSIKDGRFGEGDNRIALDEVNCRGDETSLAACNHDAWFHHDCAHTEDVGVICDTTDDDTRGN